MNEKKRASPSPELRNHDSDKKSKLDQRDLTEMAISTIQDSKPTAVRLLKGRSKHKAKNIPNLASARESLMSVLNQSFVRESNIHDTCHPKPMRQESILPHYPPVLDLKPTKTEVEILASRVDESLLDSEMRIHSTVSESLDLLRKGLMKSKPNPSTVHVETTLMTESNKNKPPLSRLQDSRGESISSIENISVHQENQESFKLSLGESSPRKRTFSQQQEREPILLSQETQKTPKVTVPSSKPQDEILGNSQESKSNIPCIVPGKMCLSKEVVEPSPKKFKKSSPVKQIPPPTRIDLNEHHSILDSLEKKSKPIKKALVEVNTILDDKGEIPDIPSE